MIQQYKVGNKVLYRVFVKGRGKAGKQIGRRRKDIPSLYKAKQIEIDLINEIRLTTNQENKIWIWKDWHEKCLEEMAMTLLHGTVVGYDGSLKQWLSDEWQAKNLHDFLKSDVFDLVHKSMGATATGPTKQKTFKRISRIFEMAVEEGIIDRNPARGIRIKIDEVQKVVLNSTEANLLLDQAREKEHRFYHVWAFGLFTGMRSGEMYALTWKDIDLETNLITVSKQWTSKDGLHHTKTRVNRVVPIGGELRELLSELKQMGGFEEVLKPLSKSNTRFQEVYCDDLVLPRIGEWKAGKQSRVLRDFCKELSITQIRFHDLRATFITNMLAQGVPLVKVMAIVGHRKMSTTDEYLRLAGVDIKFDTTDKLAYKLPKKKEDNVIGLFDRRSKA